ncbi:MAG: sortase [Clostridia bacterium]
MKSKNKLYKILILLGVICIFCAVLLLVKNEQIELNAQSYNESAVEQIKQEIENSQEEIVEDFYEIPSEEFSYEELPTETTIENETYIGVLYFYSLDLELAVQSDWSYEKLSNTPCVYQEEPFSIAGHNYTSHFGKISNLEIDDLVLFTDMSGEEFVFTVVSNTIVNETNIEALEDATYDLTLFTCNYYNNSERILIRLNLLD